MPIQLEAFLAYAVALFLLYVIGWLLLVPMKWLLRLLANGVLGGVLLILFTLLGSLLGFSVSVNVLTALIAGFLGVPGVFLLLALQGVLV
jgi:inhibitor of the pro-sigma K processing machinery